jgi:hypothetical protein
VRYCMPLRSSCERGGVGPDPGPVGTQAPSVHRVSSTAALREFIGLAPLYARSDPLLRMREWLGPLDEHYSAIVGKFADPPPDVR